MALELGGLHHVTAVTAQAPRNVDFYTRVLGLRLVKKTVNQDDVSAYHLFYGDEVGHAGTELTFFDWAQLPANRPGRGEIAGVALRVPGREALDWWAQRFETLGVAHEGVAERDGRLSLPFTDPEGQRLVLLDDTGAPAQAGTPWAASPVPAAYGIRGLGAVTLRVPRLGPTAEVLAGPLGFRQVAAWTPAGEPARRVAVFEVGPGGPGTLVRVEERPDLPFAQLGAGGVHHVAFRVPNDEEHQAWQRKLRAAGIPATPVIDRYYFRSIYFRVPGGVLFELATDGPGFATDEDAAHLGERLALPPFLEPYRDRIAAGLQPLPSVSYQEVAGA